jgi:hypothetical protein
MAESLMKDIRDRGKEGKRYMGRERERKGNREKNERDGNMGIGSGCRRDLLPTRACPQTGR